METSWLSMGVAPDNKLILVRCFSGHRQFRYVYLSVYHDPEYRPPIDGRKRWLLPDGTDIHDFGWYPVEWREIE